MPAAAAARASAAGRSCCEVLEVLLVLVALLPRRAARDSPAMGEERAGSRASASPELNGREGREEARQYSW
eukprot:8730980-Pyramimonas_sp.AAC.1